MIEILKCFRDGFVFLFCTGLAALAILGLGAGIFHYPAIFVPVTVVGISIFFGAVIRSRI